MLASLCLCLAFSAYGAVRFDVFLGYDGMVPEASWFPVTCEVQNDGPSFTGQVQIAPGQFNQGQERRMLIELPTGTTKRFVIPVFSAARSGAFVSWDIRLLDERGRVRAEQLNLRARRQLNWRIPVMGALSRTAITLPTFGDQPQRVVDWQPAVARLQPNLFPDNPIALEGLQVLYLSAERALELKANQVNALLTWLYAGGHLVLGVEQVLHVNGNEWLRPLLPCDLTGLTSRAQHAEIHAWLRSNRMSNGRDYPFVESASVSADTDRKPGRVGPVANPYARLAQDTAFEEASLQVATGTLRDGTVLFGSDTAPLAVYGRRGRGQVTVLLFSPELEPFVSWKNRPYFWAKMMNVPPELFEMKQFNVYGGVSIDGVFGSLIETLQVRKLPVGWLLLLLVAYLGVIGPLDYFWLKKINRQMLTWLTFPAYVAGFSLLIYFIGYKLRAGETEWNELHLVDVVPVGEKAELHGQTYASVYSPANARYRMGCDQPFGALRGEYQGGQEASKATIEQRGYSYAAEISVPVWTSQLYVGDWLRRDDPPLAFSITRGQYHWNVQIDNRLDRRLTDVRLIVEGRLLQVPEVPPRQVSKFTLNRDSGSALTAYVQNESSRFYQMTSQRRQAFGGNVRNYDVPKAVIAASFVGHLDTSKQNQPYQYTGGFITNPGQDLSPLVQRGDAVLVAWVPNFSPVTPLNKFSPRRGYRHSLLRVAAEVRPAL